MKESKRDLQAREAPGSVVAGFGLTSWRLPRILRRTSELRRFVAHTKPRREKKLAENCQRQSIAATLPCYSMTAVLLRLGFINQAAALKMDADSLDPI